MYFLIFVLWLAALKIALNFGLHLVNRLCMESLRLLWHVIFSHAALAGGKIRCNSGLCVDMR